VLAHLGPWDLALIVVVSLQATLLAYLPQPEWKAILSTLPIPFTVAFLAVGEPVAATNVLGLVLVFLYVQEVRWLHGRWSLPIVPAIALSAISYTLIGTLVAPRLPTTDDLFWVTSGLVWLLGIVLLLRMPRRTEPGHRSPMPIYLKIPVVMGVIVFLVLIKRALLGFATVFPMVSIVAAYEARYSLWTLGRQMPILMVAMVPMMGAIRLTQTTGHLGLALLAGWLVFLCLYAPLTWAVSLSRHRCAAPPHQA
jgi:hypothetical protein